MTVPHVVVVGAGFAGLKAAKWLKRVKVKVTVLDRTNHHLFQPLLYQVAMAGLSPAEIAAPIRAVLSRNSNTNVELVEVTGFDLEAKKVETTGGSVAYDYLVVAAGSQTSYFGHKDWESIAPGLKTVEDATEIRRRVLTVFETAEREPDSPRRKELLTFVVIGGGPTGVELAGALAELARTVLANDFRAIRPREARIVLIEGGERVLPSMSPETSKSAQEQLEELGVEVFLGARVEQLDEHGVSTSRGDRFDAATVLWAAGVRPSPLARALHVPLDKQGRVIVEPDLSVLGHPEVFVIGDMASAKSDGGTLPGLAPVAMQQGRFVARTIARAVAGKPRKPFHYVDKGMMATIGRSRAVVESFGVRVSGFIAWLAWLFVHVLYLIGFRNRFVVLLTWAWSYLTYRRGARLITARSWQPHAELEAPAPSDRRGSARSG